MYRTCTGMRYRYIKDQTIADGVIFTLPADDSKISTNCTYCPMMKSVIYQYIIIRCKGLMTKDVSIISPWYGTKRNTMLITVSGDIDRDFSEDILYDGLLHIKPLINRSKLFTHIRNPIQRY